MSNLDTSKTLRPGLLVALKTSIAGNVKYAKRVLDAAEIDTNGTLTAKWETAKTVMDAAEQAEAAKIRSQARNIVSRVCAVTAFGYLCPEADRAELDKAFAEANALVSKFNDEATLTRVYFYAITGRVAADDVEAVKAINAEVRTLLSDMQDGIEKLDVKKIRKAADEARQLGQMLTPDAQARITVAIEAARKTASKINAAGEQAAAEIDQRAIRTLTEARTAFLDLDETGREIGQSFAAGRAVDLGASDVKAAAPGAPARQTDLI